MLDEKLGSASKMLALQKYNISTRKHILENMNNLTRLSQATFVTRGLFYYLSQACQGYLSKPENWHDQNRHSLHQFQREHRNYYATLVSPVNIIYDRFGVELSYKSSEFIKTGIMMYGTGKISASDAHLREKQHFQKILNLNSQDPKNYYATLTGVFLNNAAAYTIAPIVDIINTKKS